MSENKRSRKNNASAFFSIPKHYKPISIAAPLSNLQGGTPTVVLRAFKPITLLFNHTARSCQNALFSSCISPLLGSSSPGDLENVCSPKRLPPSEENSHKQGGADVVKKKKMLLCMIIRAQAAISNKGRTANAHATSILSACCLHWPKDAFGAKTEGCNGRNRDSKTK